MLRKLLRLSTSLRAPATKGGLTKTEEKDALQLCRDLPRLWACSVARVLPTSAARGYSPHVSKGHMQVTQTSSLPPPPPKELCRDWGKDQTLHGTRQRQGFGLSVHPKVHKSFGKPLRSLERRRAFRWKLPPAQLLSVLRPSKAWIACSEASTATMVFSLSSGDGTLCSLPPYFKCDSAKTFILARRCSES